ncbi:MAG: hypothetical protein ACI8RD_003985 [Bacillariaceae sp.]|jgi:hypothetical protein
MSSSSTSSSGIVIGERKRSRNEMEISLSAGRLDNTNNSNTTSQVDADADADADADQKIISPLQGVVASLSGYDQHRKEELHQLILSLGGRYTRELNLDKNTHLITEVAHGAKYKLAVSSSDTPQIVHIVTPSWLNSTSETGLRALESDHKLELLLTGTAAAGTAASDVVDSKPSLLSLVNNALVDPALQIIMGINENSSPHSSSSIFEDLHFYLIGFEGNVDLKQKISKLVRRGNGTIYWDMNEDISIILLCDTCDETLQKAAKVVSFHHFNQPRAVSPLWVIDSYTQNVLKPVAAYPPITPTAAAVAAAAAPYNNKTHNNEQMMMKSTKKGGVTKASSSKISSSTLSSTTSNFSVFRGCLFSLVRSSTLAELEESSEKKETHDNNVEYDINEQETFIKAHGGQILSMKLLDALWADANNKNTVIGTNGSSSTKTTKKATSSSSKRKCHIVCWGGCPPRLDTSPLVSQLQRHDLCELILVTPIWVQACVSMKKRIQPERMPLVLMPQSWPMKSLDDDDDDNDNVRKLEISLTGFQGTEKAVIIHLIEAIGGVYHNNMSNINTHLIFKKNATGLKLQKANEWGLHVVSIQWLYHVLEYGYGGDKNDKLGCEKIFSLAGN